MGYRKEALKGVSWVGLLRGSTRVVSLIKIAIVARILGPELYGHYGIALLVLSLLGVLTETGVNVVLIQKKEEIDEYIPTAWIVSIVRGILIAGFILASAPFIAKFFGAPSASSVLLLLAAVPFVRGFINPSIVKFQKDLLFKKDFLYRFTIFTIDAVFAVGLTYILKSPVGLIWGNIIGDIYGTIASFYLIKPRPTLRFEKQKAAEVISRGKWITLSGIFQYMFREGDDVVVGRLLGSGSLGLYQLAYRIATLPISEVGDVIGKVIFPVYTKISNDKNRLIKAFRQTTIAISLVSIPFGLVLFVFARQVILIALGADWLAAVNVLRAVVIYAVLRAIIDPTIQILLALKHQSYVTVITLIGIIGMGATIFPLVNKWGILGAGISTIIGISLTIPFSVYLLNKALKHAFPTN